MEARMMEDRDGRRAVATRALRLNDLERLQVLVDADRALGLWIVRRLVDSGHALAFEGDFDPFDEPELEWSNGRWSEAGRGITMHNQGRIQHEWAAKPRVLTAPVRITLEWSPLLARWFAIQCAHHAVSGANLTGEHERAAHHALNMAASYCSMPSMPSLLEGARDGLGDCLSRLHGPMHVGSARWSAVCCVVDACAHESRLFWVHRSMRGALGHAASDDAQEQRAAIIEAGAWGRSLVLACLLGEVRP